MGQTTCHSLNVCVVGSDQEILAVPFLQTTCYLLSDILASAAFGFHPNGLSFHPGKSVPRRGNLLRFPQRLLLADLGRFAVPVQRLQFSR